MGRARTPGSGTGGRSAGRLLRPGGPHVHIAYSVILFTTASGLGYGLLILLGIMGPAGLIAIDRGFGAAAFALAFTAVTLALLADALDRSHPKNILRAAGGGRAVWLMRERVAAVATYLPAGAFALGWVAWEHAGGAFALLGVIGAAAALTTVCATGMIYARLSAIPAWANGWTVPGYLTLALATASLWQAALAHLFDIAHPAITHLPVAFLMLAWIVKAAYWWRLDNPASGNEGGFVMGETGYRFARGHARRLRRAAQGLAFVVPLVLTELEMFLPDASPGFHTVTAFVCACLGTLGAGLERWLFFAEARHAAPPDHRGERG